MKHYCDNEYCFYPEIFCTSQVCQFCTKRTEEYIEGDYNSEQS